MKVKSFKYLIKNEFTIMNLLILQIINKPN